MYFGVFSKEKLKKANSKPIILPDPKASSLPGIAKSRFGCESMTMANERFQKRGSKKLIAVASIVHNLRSVVAIGNIKVTIANARVRG